MKKALITGITGFVGRHLQEHLNNSFEVDGVSRRLNKTPKLITYDQLSVAKLGEYESFIHLAGKAHDLKNTSDEQEYYNVNAKLTAQLFDKFLESKAKVFIYLSSVKAVKDSVNNILTETATPNPLTPYGKSKLMAEKYILSKSIPEDKSVYILRPCMIHGPDNKGNLNLLYNIIRRGIPYPLGAFNNRRSFLSVYNLCFVINQILVNKPESGIYNVADDTAISTNDLVSLIGTYSKKHAKILKLPKHLVYFIAKLGNYIPIPLNNERLEKLTENYEVSNKKIKGALNCNLPLTTQEGISITIKSFS